MCRPAQLIDPRLKPHRTVAEAEVQVTIIAVEEGAGDEEEAAAGEEEEAAVEEAPHEKTAGTTHVRRSPVRTKASRSTTTARRSYQMRKREPSSGRP